VQTPARTLLRTLQQQQQQQQQQVLLPSLRQSQECR
jgi:hypothetical protein